MTPWAAPWKESLIAAAPDCRFDVMQRFALAPVPFVDVSPYLGGGLREPEQLRVLGVDHPFVDEKLEIHGTPPEALADEDHRQRSDFRAWMSASISNNSSIVP